MKKFGKWWIVIGIFFLIVLLSKDCVLKTVVTTVGSSVIGAQIKMKKFSLGLLTQKVRIKGLTIDNPAGFEKRPFIEIPELIIHCHLLALLKGEIHIPLAVLDLKRMTVVKNERKELNVDSLKIVQQIYCFSSGLRKGEGSIIPKRSRLHLHIDLLKLNIGQVIVKDYSKGRPPVIRAYEVDLKNKTFHDIKGVSHLATLVITQAMKPAAIKGAGIYAAAALTGVGLIPAGVVGVIAAKDDASAEILLRFKEVFHQSLTFARETGVLKKSDQGRGIISAKIQGCDVKITIEKISFRKTKLNVSARKFFVPKRSVAGGILHQIRERLE